MLDRDKWFNRLQFLRDLAITEKCAAVNRKHELEFEISQLEKEIEKLNRSYELLKEMHTGRSTFLAEKIDAVGCDPMTINLFCGKLAFEVPDE